MASLSKLPWIDDDRLSKAVSNMLLRARKAKKDAADNIIKNVIDPFSSIVLATTSGLTKADSLAVAQQMNSASSGISSAVGDFHQEILGLVKGFKNHDSGYDLECSDMKIIGEVKNKYNTMNATNRRKVVEELETAIRQRTGNWTAYLVIIIPKKPQRYKKKLGTLEVYEIDGTSFYELATGHKTALHDLYYAVEEICRATYTSQTNAPHDLCYAAEEIVAEDQPNDEIIDYCKKALINGIPK